MLLCRRGMHMLWVVSLCQTNIFVCIFPHIIADTEWDLLYYAIFLDSPSVSACVCVRVHAHVWWRHRWLLRFSQSCSGTPWLCFSAVLFRDFIFTIVPVPPGLQMKHWGQRKASNFHQHITCATRGEIIWTTAMRHSSEATRRSINKGYKAVSYKLRRVLKDTKSRYRDRMELQMEQHDTRCLWQGLWIYGPKWECRPWSIIGSSL